MIALLRYQAANLFRSHRWIFPLITYALLISVGGAGPGKQALADGLDWSAAILLPVVALLTRSMLTAEPAAARACVSAARGPGRAQLAALITALAAGAVLGLAGAGYELVTSGHGTALLGPLAAGLGKALVCALGRCLARDHRCGRGCAGLQCGSAAAGRLRACGRFLGGLLLAGRAPGGLTPAAPDD